ncbi:3-carboxy-cis,cis-muconate cycloisomerase [Micromonospora sp. KC213]|uniref:3-carboxy-cis,cis-muconate cycloisomerase n=1 Tax=Micromonospora sp. KC213 TaxID=2530378 RepID=UPI001FB590C4|nr:3-carboxy-cis,cis-muconate cycloisomerase [Micromonospora sp. KC213]
MSFPDPATSPCPAADVGLLSPGWAGSAGEAATGDTAYVRAMLDAEAALTRAQAALGLTPAAAADAVDAAVADLSRYDARGLALRARATGNPVVPLVADLTAVVAEHDPAAAPYVHRGATSQDIWDTATMLVAFRALESALADLHRAAAVLTRLAEEHRDTVMPGRTLTQHAVPTTFGLKAAGWRHLVLAAHHRLAAVRAVLPVQLGGAAGTLAAFHAYAEADGHSVPDNLGPRLLGAYARETGLAEPILPWHTLRTPIADLTGALALTVGALGKVAADVLALSRTEIGEVTEGRGGGSSTMPHKANPVRSVLVAVAARQVPALASVLYGSLAAEDERPPSAWHAEWQALREALRLVCGAARDTAEMVARLSVDPGRMRENLDATHGLIATERLVAAFGPLIGRDRANEVLTRAARYAAEKRVSLYDALDIEPSIAGAVSGEQLRALTDPARYLGSAGVLVDRALSRRSPFLEDSSS